MPDWQDAAIALWGEDWIAPLSEVLGINRRTVERWKAQEGAPRQMMQDALAMLARRSGADARAMGDTLRRMAGGVTPQQIADEMHAITRSLRRIEHMGDTLTVLGRGGVWPPDQA